MCAKPLKKEPRQVETTGHKWDGIEEWNNPLPRWWVWVFYATIVWGIGYTVAYPAWPLLTGATPGLIGGNTRLDVAAEIAAVDKANEGVKTKLVAADLNAIGADPELAAYAENAGAAVFRTNCATCHGSGAAGFEGKGYPNLLDDDWLWGGTMEDIHLTITHGIRNTTDADARYSEMPKFGVDGILDETQIAQVAEHVLALSGQEHDAAAAAAGATVYVDAGCNGCHMDDGTGDRAQGAPNLTDAIWLYGGSREKIIETVTKARFGVMPNWNTRLSEDEIRAVAFYVHGRGGGE
ncbi:MAG: cytochrome-c oxidase, cbb3-type subunit III [Tabrizicola sp.]|nr:cytochrome-c oxidase, cbb3-type subunit III [Tabrizicola sp.]HMS95420.1 cytochrome-c oxidase, cbb3-type subunit III [Tabrizicola sp.]